jgi:hypothetical protein
MLLFPLSVPIAPYSSVGVRKACPASSKLREFCVLCHARNCCGGLSASYPVRTRGSVFEDKEAGA